MKNQIDIKDQKTLARILDAALQTEAGETKILACMDRLFASGAWEIPDEAVVGLVKNKVDQLDAQVKSLTGLLANLSAKIEGPSASAKSRIDPLASKNKK